MIEPVYPGQGGLFHLFQAPPRLPVDHIGLVRAVDDLGQGVFVRVAHAAHRGLDARLGQVLGI